MAVMSASAVRSVPEATDRDECPPCLAGNLNWLLTKAHYALATELTVEFAPLGITPRGHAVLCAAATGAHSQKALADLVGLDKTTMVATIDELEQSGLARRVPSPTDRRAHVIEVSSAGLRMIASANEIVSRIQSDVFGSLGDDAGEELLHTLARLVNARLAEATASKSLRRREPRVAD